MQFGIVQAVRDGRGIVTVDCWVDRRDHPDGGRHPNGLAALGIPARDSLASFGPTGHRGRMMNATKTLATLLGLSLAFAGYAARAQERVDLLLVLAADVSRSVTAPKFKLQREGAAAAITHPEVLRAITSGTHRRIAVCFVEWASAGQQNVLIDWTVIADEKSAVAFGGKLLESPRSFAGSTSISDAIDFSVRQLERAPFISERHVIDVSGDGTNVSGRPVEAARDEAAARGITINGLVILTRLEESFRPEHTNPSGGLEKYFRDNVIGGVGAFTLVAEGHESFGRAMTRKLIAEIAGLPAPQLADAGAE